MEELHKPHKDVPFGWVALIAELMAARRARRAIARPQGSTWPRLLAPR